MDTEGAVQYLAEIQFKHLRRGKGCGKLQFTPYGKCISCEWSEDCQKLSWIMGVKEEQDTSG